MKWPPADARLPLTKLFILLVVNSLAYHSLPECDFPIFHTVPHLCSTADNYSSFQRIFVNWGSYLCVLGHTHTHTLNESNNVLLFFSKCLNRMKNEDFITRTVSKEARSRKRWNCVGHSLYWCIRFRDFISKGYSLRRLINLLGSQHRTLYTG